MQSIGEVNEKANLWGVGEAFHVEVMALLFEHIALLNSTYMNRQTKHLQMYQFNIVRTDCHSQTSN